MDGAVAKIISSVVNVVINTLSQVVDDVIHLDRNTLRLQETLRTAKAFLEGTDTQFHHQQRSIPPELNEKLGELRHSVDDAESLISSSQQRQGCLDRRFCNPRLCRQIRKCNTDLQGRQNNLRDTIIPTVRGIQEIVSSAPLRPEAQLQPVPESGYVGTGIKSAEMQLNTWLEADDNQFRVIGIYGMGGIGKTSLLKAVYNTYKQLKGDVFQVVIWLTVAQKFNILDLQSSIAEAINLQLGSTSNAQSSTSNALETRKMKLFGRLKEMKFLLILDDTWESIQLEEELGIPVGKDNGSKVVISSRRRDVIRGMGADDRYSIQIQPLSPIESWQLFYRVAFKSGDAPTKRIEDIARQIAEECNGLPLALNVVAAALTNASAEDWDLALTQMKNVDPHLLTMFRGIDEHLYGRLKWSYDRLNDCKLKNCFLFCGAFPEDAEIRVETLVEMWIGEGLVQSRDKSQFMSAGRRYVTLLVERCLFQYTSKSMNYIKVHDTVRDLALYIADNEEKCLFRTSQKLHEFPAVMDDCKRIAIRYYNDDTDAFLPTDFRCPKLGTLILSQNESLREVPNGFFLNLTSLRVLDLSDTNITSLPESLWQLKQLEFLGLNHTKINSLPADICNLSRLQFLHLAGCRQLESLPRTMAELKNLKHLDLNGCGRLAGIPREICQLTSLNKLQLPMYPSKLGVDKAESGMCSLKDFTNFPNLMELHVCVKPGMIVDGIALGIKEGTMATWLEMRHLVLEFDLKQKEEVVEDLPRDMQNMKKLQTLNLVYYGGIRLPNCICDFEGLEELRLYYCRQLEELPPLERLPNLRVLELKECSKVRELGITGSVGGFPMLERLEIVGEVRGGFPMLERLDSISSSSSNVVWTEGTMPKLQTLTIYRCRALKRLPIGIEKLSNLKELQIEKDVWDGLIWEDINVKICLENKATMM